MDFYVILGIERTASQDAIKRAYKRLARRFHPDINPGDRLAAHQFREIAEAYETLSDPDRRKRYDSHGAARGVAAQTAPDVGFEGFDFSVRVSGAEASTFGDLFAGIFEQRAAAETSRDGRGVDLHQTIDLTFDEALHGTQRTMTITRLEPCATCRGAGRLNVAETRCATCHGTGVIKGARGHMVFTRPCAACGGAGRVAHAPCAGCGGQQLTMQSESLTVNVPAGLADGARIRVNGKGHAGRGGENGDLYISVRVQPHPLFRRDGDDLLITVPIAVHEAALGAKIDVPSPDGPARVRVPPGTQAGQRFHLRERGVPSPRSGRRGDLIVEVQIVLPRVLDERSKELMREFGRINSGDVREALGPSIVPRRQPL